MRIARPHWSYSQLSQFLRCPLQYYFERIARLPRPYQSSGMVLGRAIHEVMADYHRLLQQHRAVDRGALVDSVSAKWTDAENSRPVLYRDGETRRTQIACGVALLEAYLNEPPPDEVLSVEETWVVPLVTARGQVLEKPLVAMIDFITRENDQLVVNEIKTSSRRYSALDIETAQQATTYTLVLKERFGMLAPVRYIVLVKTKTPAVQRAELNRTEGDLSRLGDLFHTVEKAIAARAFYPIESPLNCSTCPFRQPCRDWQGTGKHLALVRHPKEAIPAC